MIIFSFLKRLRKSSVSKSLNSSTLVNPHSASVLAISAVYGRPCVANQPQRCCWVDSWPCWQCGGCSRGAGCCWNDVERTFKPPNVMMFVLSTTFEQCWSLFEWWRSNVVSPPNVMVLVLTTMFGRSNVWLLPNNAGWCQTVLRICVRWRMDAPCRTPTHTAENVRSTFSPKSYVRY